MWCNDRCLLYTAARHEQGQTTSAGLGHFHMIDETHK